MAVKLTVCPNIENFCSQKSGNKIHISVHTSGVKKTPIRKSDQVEHSAPGGNEASFLIYTVGFIWD